MSIIINGMHYNWDYSELIKELKEEISYSKKYEQEFKYIQILRTEKPKFGDYRPIINYYYTDDRMKLIYKPDVFDNREELLEKKNMELQYMSVRPNLELVEIEKVLEEMHKVNALF